MFLFNKLNFWKIIKTFGFIYFIIIPNQGCSEIKTIDEFKNDETCIKYLEDIVPRIAKKKAITGLSIAVIKNGKILWTGAYGYINRKTS